MCYQEYFLENSTLNQTIDELERQLKESINNYENVTKAYNNLERNLLLMDSISGELITVKQKLKLESRKFEESNNDIIR